ncbi:MAG: protein kinase [Sandaracinaceae bacterium]|nr:protein kinase [Sandaracinaceae bacterium]
MSGDEAQQAEERSAPDLIGKVISGKYRIRRVLGRGGMGSIYAATQEPLGRQVAIKVLHPTLGEGDPEFQKRFLLEAAVLAQLSHPNIVVVHDYGSLEDDTGSCYMVMELLEGKTINQLLNEEKTFTPSRAVRIARDIARALRAAHNLNVVHRDLKPSNVMLCKGHDGEVVKVLDFGLVKVLRDDSEELTAEGRFLGSPRYMAPEQIQRLPMDGRTDLYALGVILYRMLCGEVPFAGEHAVQTLMAHLTEKVPPMFERTGVRVPMAVEQIVLKLLEKEKEKRYENAEALIRALDFVWPQLSDEPLLTSGEFPRPVELTPISLTSGHLAQAQPTAPAKRFPVLPVLVGVGLLVGLGGAWAAASLLEEPAPPPVEGQPQPQTQTVPAQPPDPMGEPVRIPPPPTSARTFELTITSDPSGATIVRDGVEIGTTPLVRQEDLDALTEHPATFTLRRAGYAPYVWTQGPSEAPVTIEGHLPRLARPGGNGRPPRGTSEPGPTGPSVSIKTAR